MSRFCEWSDGYEELRAIPHSFAVELKDGTVWSMFTDTDSEKVRSLPMSSLPNLTNNCPFLSSHYSPCCTELLGYDLSLTLCTLYPCSLCLCLPYTDGALSYDQVPVSLISVFRICGPYSLSLQSNRPPVIMRNKVYATFLLEVAGF